MLAREPGDKRQIEWALRVLSFDEPDLTSGGGVLQECERLFRELGNEMDRGWVTSARLAFDEEGNLDRPRRLWSKPRRSSTA